MNKIPVVPLFGKYPNMTKSCKGQAKGKVQCIVLVSDLPTLGHIRVFRPSSFYIVCETELVFLLANKFCVSHSFPLCFVQHFAPDRLRLGSDQNVFSETLKFFEISRVDRKSTRLNSSHS